MFRKIGFWLQAGTLASLMPVMYITFTGLQHIPVKDGLRSPLATIASIGLSVAMALGLGYVGSEALSRIGLSPVALRRLMLSIWAYGTAVLAALVTAGHATAADGLHAALGGWAYVLVLGAVVAAEGLVVAALLADRLKTVEAEGAQELELAKAEAEAQAEKAIAEKAEAENALAAARAEAAELAEKLRVMTADRDEWCGAAEGDAERAAALERELGAVRQENAMLTEGAFNGNAELEAAREELAKALRTKDEAIKYAADWMARATNLSEMLDALRLEGAGAHLPAIAEHLAGSIPLTIAQLAADLDIDNQAVRTAADRGVALGLLAKIPAPPGINATWVYKRQRPLAQVAEMTAETSEAPEAEAP